MKTLSSKPVLFPVKRTLSAGTYSDAQWEAIRKSLARIGVDLNITVTPNWAAHPLPLPEVLQDLSRAFAGLPASPYRSWQLMIRDMRQAMAALEAAHAILARYGDTEVETIDAELMPVIAKTRRRLDRLVKEWGPRANARRVHIGYWNRLAQLWQQIIAEHKPTRRSVRKDLVEFLRVCSSASFPAAATEYALKNFIDRPQTRR
jgi:hypothetical protein